MKDGPCIVIVDYGVGNLFSLERAFSFLGLRSLISGNAVDLEAADALILPGVGAFGDGMRELKERGLDERLRFLAGAGKPLLGVCLGMQLLMSQSEEFGVHQGLDLIKGRVVRFPDPCGDENYKIPHVGWSPLLRPDGADGWRSPILRGIDPEDWVYFTHSYYAIPDDPSDVCALTPYAGIRYASAVAKGNISGVQFHPEESGMKGLLILKGFVQDAVEKQGVVRWGN